MKPPMNRIIYAPREEVEMNLELLAESLTKQELKQWMLQYHDVMNDRQTFAYIDRAWDYPSPSQDTMLRLKLYTLYEVLESD